MSARRRLWIRIMPWVALALVVASPGPGLAAKPPPTCSLVPQVLDVTVNQGLAAYAPLVRKKEALFKVYLGLPSCIAANQTIRVTGGSLTVNNGSTTSSAVGPFPAVDPINPPFITTTGTTPALAAPADLIFPVPGPFIDSSGGTSFNAAFSARIDYQSQSGTNAPVTNFITVSRSLQVGPSGNKSLRLLVVPMGNLALANGGWSDSAQRSVESAMATLSRTFPVPRDGRTGTTTDVTDLTGTGGIRYTMNPIMDLAALGVLNADGKFCGRASNFEGTIAPQLAQRLTLYNQNNPSPADVVLGVVDEAMALDDTSGCDLGRAIVGYKTGAWAMARYRSTPSTAGIVTSMEITHNFGAVPDARDSSTSLATYHSPRTAADLGSNRGFNVTDRAFLADDRSVMRAQSSGWNEATGIHEKADFEFLYCKLGGPVNTECQATGPAPGTTGAVGSAFIFTADVDDSLDPPVAHVLESQFELGADILPETVRVEKYFLAECNPGCQANGSGLLRATALPFSDARTHHGDDEVQVHLDHISGAFAVTTNFATLELWQGRPGTAGAVQLYSRPTGAVPVVGSPTVTTGATVATNYTPTFTADDRDPAISLDGQWVAWEQTIADVAEILVAPIADSEQYVTVPNDGIDLRDPTWGPGGLAFVADGDIYTIPVDVTFGAPSFGDPFQVYDADPIEPGGPPNASDPSFNLDGTRIAFAAGGRIRVIGADGTGETAITTGPNDSQPSWSHTAGDNRIAFVRRTVEPILLLASGDPSPTAESIPLAIPRRPSRTPRILNHDGAIVVNSAIDADDGSCDPLDVDDSSLECTLREAISHANTETNATITFAVDPVGSVVEIPVELGSFDINAPMTIDGTSQVGGTGPGIALAGPDGGTGLLLDTAGGSTIRGLIMYGFTDAIRIESTADHTIAGNWLGLDPTGDAAPGNSLGVVIDGADATGNVVGGSTEADRNVISKTGGGSAGVYITNGASANAVRGNYIGTDKDGEAALSLGGQNGVELEGAGPGNVIGGPTDADRNVISGNGKGVVVSATTNPNTIQGNYIGVGANGTADVGNSGPGVEMTLASSATNILDNVVSGNGTYGVLVGGSSTNATIQGNGIGTDATGSAGVPNGAFGVYLASGSSVVGGDSAGQGNVISGNASAGMRMDGSNNVVMGNFIGTDPTGAVALPNADGVVIVGGANNTIEGNVISGNSQTGVLLSGASATGNIIVGNMIGTDISGTADLGNHTGIAEGFGAGGTFVGTVAGGNVISGNTSNGIQLLGSGGDHIVGNMIGTDVLATASIPNNGGVIIRAPNVTLGGDIIDSGNVISGNLGNGVEVSTSAATGVTILGNFVGVQADGSPLGNQGTGIIVGSDASNTTIGSTAAVGANTIAFNQTWGVFIGSGNSTSIRGNSIHSNGNLGIDIAIPLGVNPNDGPGDPDAGTNGLQNYPVITSAVPGAPGTISGTLASTASSNFDVDLFGNAACDATSGTNGEGQTYLGSTIASTDGSGNASWTYTGANVPSTGVVTATATNQVTGDTSEFSACVAAGTEPSADLAIEKEGTPSLVAEGDSITYTLTVRNEGPDTATNVVVTDHLPDGVSVDSADTDDGGTCVAVDDLTQQCQLDDMPSGDTTTITIVVTVDNANPGDILTNEADVTGDASDPNGDNNSAQVATEVGENDFQILIVDPDAPATPTFLVNGRAPSWGDGLIAHTFDAGIRIVEPDGAPIVDLTMGNIDTLPALSNSGAIVFQRGDEIEGEVDIYQLQLSQRIQWPATDPDSPEADLRGHVLFTCGEENFVESVGLVPEVAGATATFTDDFVPWRTCEGGTKTLFVTDGLNFAGGPPATVESEAKPPVASIHLPVPNQRYLRYDGIHLEGHGKDPDDGELVGQWFMEGGGQSKHAVGTGQSVDLSPPANGWIPGEYTVYLEVTDSDGNLATDQRTIFIDQDADHDGMSELQEACLGSGADNDPFNAGLDSEPSPDGIRNVDDIYTAGGPCVSATDYEAVADFDPDTLFVPSKGTSVTVFVRLPYRDLTKVAMSTVTLTLVIEEEGANNPTFPATSWTVSGGVATAKFSRQAVNSWLLANGVMNVRVPIMISGQSLSQGWQFTGADSVLVLPG